jgi:hypothetical protein
VLFDTNLAGEYQLCPLSPKPPGWKPGPR